MRCAFLTVVCALLPLLAGSAAAQRMAPWMLGPFEKPKQANPVITPNGAATFQSPMQDSVVHWEEYATFNPAAIVRSGRVYVLYRAEDASGEMKIGNHTSRIGLAESRNGLRFTRRPTPVLFPDKDGQRGNEWTGGVEDPRVVETEDGTYVLTYTQWNRDVPRLAVATSRDLLSWTKHGPAFAKAAGGKSLGSESKSGATGRNRVNCLMSAGLKPVTVMKPIDNSDIGWRVVKYEWIVTELTGTPLKKVPIGRCGNSNAIQISDFVRLEPGSGAPDALRHRRVVQRREQPRVRRSASSHACLHRRPGALRRA